MPSRFASVDMFRGFAIISMIIVNFLAFFDSTPFFLKHAKGQFITFADIVAPLFLFVLGMMYRKSVARRIAKAGRYKVYLQFIRRYLLILIIGIVGGCAGKLRFTLDWGILQTIGLAGLISLPFMESAVIWRSVAGGVLIITHYLVILPFAQESIAVSEQGGPIAVPAWAAIILLSSVAGDMLDTNSNIQSIRKIFLLGLILIIIGLLVLPFIPISKSIVSPSYVLIATGISAFVFIVFLGIADIARFQVPTLATLGRNALLIFLLHYILVRIGHTIMDRSTGLIFVLLGALIIYTLCYLLSQLFDQKGIYLKL